MIKKYAASMLGQAALSAFQFALGLLLVRSWDAELFGVYSFWQTIVLIVAGIQAVLITVPLSVHLPTHTHETERRQVEAVFSRVNLALVVVTVFIFLGLFVLFQESHLVAFPLVAFAMMYLFREYVKGVALARLHPVSALLADLAYISVCSTLLLVYAFGYVPLSLPIVFGVVGLGSLVGGLIGIAAERPRYIAHPFQATIREYSKVWEQSRWALFGFFTSQLQLRGYVFLVSSLAGFSVLGVLSAGMVLLRPVHVLYGGWARIARPQLVEAAASLERAVFVRVLGQGLGLMVAALVGLFSLLFFSWNYIETIVFNGRYGEIGIIVAGWAVVIAFQSIRAVLQTALAALNKFQPSAIATTYGAVVSLLAIVGVLRFFDWTLVPAGLAVGEIVSIGYLVPRVIKETASLRSA